jgi:hypothetical protein
MAFFETSAEGAASSRVHTVKPPHLQLAQEKKFKSIFLESRGGTRADKAEETNNTDALNTPERVEKAKVRCIQGRREPWWRGCRTTVSL